MLLTIILTNYYIISRNFTQKALAYVRRSMEIFHANLSAWDLPYSESCMANVKHKESVLLQFLDNKSKS